jgi:hypothetical protein
MYAVWGWGVGPVTLVLTEAVLGVEAAIVVAPPHEKRLDQR